MNLENQINFFKNFTASQERIMLKKGNDYSNEDRLSNFKLAAAIVNTTAEKLCLSLMAVKVARLGTLLGVKTPNNESIEDTLLDLANYTILLAMIRQDDEDAAFELVKNAMKDINTVR